MRRSGPTSLTLTLLILMSGMCLCSGPARAADFGSSTILKACFPADSLKGRAGERHIGPWHDPDRSPPAQTMPTQLPPLQEGAVTGCIRRVDTEVKAVALTFDLCELTTKTAGYDYLIVDFLRQSGIRATFFAGGKWMRSHPERAAQLMSDPLFQVGNHGWTHGNLGVLSGDPAREQVLWSMGQYETLRSALLARPCARDLGPGEAARIPAVLNLFRLPYGRASRDSLAMLASFGLSVIQWDVVGDEGGGDPDAAARHTAAEVRPGSIILMHANAVPKGTAAMLPRLVSILRRQGYEFVTVGELLRLGPALASSECYFRHPGDNLIEDRIYGDGTVHPRRR